MVPFLEKHKKPAPKTSAGFHFYFLYALLSSFPITTILSSVRWLRTPVWLRWWWQKCPAWATACICWRVNFHSFHSPSRFQSNPSSPDCPKPVVKLVAKGHFQIISHRTIKLLVHFDPRRGFYRSIFLQCPDFHLWVLTSRKIPLPAHLIQLRILLPQKSLASPSG